MKAQSSLSHFDSTLNRIDQIVTERLNLVKYISILDNSGICLYFIARYHQTQKSYFADKAIEVLERTIDSANDHVLNESVSLVHPLASVSWLTNSLIISNILDESEGVDSIRVAKKVIKSVDKNNLSTNHHDLFYGFIGQSILWIEQNQNNGHGYLKKIIKALKENAQNDKDGFFWKTPYPFFSTAVECEQTINFGIPHGCSGIVLFLLKYLKIYGTNSPLEAVLSGHIQWVINRLNKEKNKLRHFYSSIE